MKFKQMKSPENGLKPNFSGLILVDHLGLEFYFEVFTIYSILPQTAVLCDLQVFNFL